ncbi:hypothetical protein J6W91_03515 [Candidatus Saccharibacteria bacterium]|nr:hypothetical protein [Candidatus Saccharibacteria bacterium]
MRKTIAFLILAISFALFSFAPVSALEIPVEVEIVAPTPTPVVLVEEETPVVPDTSGNVKKSEEIEAAYSGILIMVIFIALCTVGYIIFIKKYMKDDKSLKARFRRTAIAPLILTFLFVTVATAVAFIPVLNKKSHAEEANGLDFKINEGDFKFKINKGEAGIFQKTVKLGLTENAYSKYRYHVSAKTADTSLRKDTDEISSVAADEENAVEKENLLADTFGISINTESTVFKLSPVEAKLEKINHGEVVELTITINVDEKLPVGTYKNDILLDVEATPTIADIEGMQDISSELCSNTDDSLITTLVDSRDGNSYKVFKGLDGRCWMGQNLRLVGPITLTSADSDIEDDFSLPEWDGTWDGYYDESENKYEDGKQTAYYNYYAASAGTISGTGNMAEAEHSICPMGWKMPSKTEWSELFSAYSLTNQQTPDNLAIASLEPLNLSSDGYMCNLSTNSCEVGIRGDWWSSTAYSADARYNSQYVSFGTEENGEVIFTASVNPEIRWWTQNGLTLRCVAR